MKCFQLVVFVFLTSSVSTNKKKDHCHVTKWSSWSTCAPLCGIVRHQSRSRQRDPKKDHNSCKLNEVRKCQPNTCQNGGTLTSAGCACVRPYSGVCCETVHTTTGRACEDQKMTLFCPTNTTILTENANYGRLSASFCARSNGKATNCLAQSSMSIVKKACNGKRTCNIMASNSVFHDPCPGVFKYLEVQYSCIHINPCVGYISLNSEQRSTAFIIPKGSISTADDRRMKQAWYRFIGGAGGVMPTDCPAIRACGTLYPVWLDDNHPTTVNQEKIMKACARTNNKCCANNWQVTAKKCSKDGENYFVYNLKGTAGGSMRYCAGKEKRCRVGESSPTGFTPGCSNHCVGYISLNSEQRSTAFIIPKGSISTADDRRMKQAWYRFIGGAGGVMPTDCPAIRACGTLYPVWLDDNHPTTVNQEKIMKACVRTNNKCCANNWQVTAKKCSKDGENYFVYNLKGTAGGSMRYCAGKEKRCRVGESSPTGFTPGCSSKFPKLKRDPIVTVDVKDSRVRFKCNIDSQDTQENVRHEVTWYEGPPEKKLDATTVLRGSEREAYLQNTNSYGDPPTFCLGKNIYCIVSSYYDDQVKDTGKFPRKSNEFFAGFEIHPKVIDLPEKNKPAKITVTTTIPIVCQDKTENCRVLLEIGQTNSKDSFVDWCTLRFKPGPANQRQELEVVAKRDFVDDGDQTMFIKLFVPDHVDPVDWNCYNNITQVKVVTKDVKTAICKSTGDPHLTTLDGLYYNHFHVGDYVMVESKARLFQVHVRTYRCHRVSCNCAVAVREGDDVVVVDMCRDNVPRARFASTVEPRSGTTIERNRNGKSFVLNFPSGAYVRFDAQKWFGRYYYANLVVQLPSDDYRNTSGLCGTYDGNKQNDLTAKDGNIYQRGSRKIAPKQFTESWRIAAGESLFYYKGGAAKCSGERTKYYCTCSEECCDKTKRKVSCDFEGYSNRPKYKQGFRGWKNLEFPGAENCGKRKRRSLNADSIVLPDDGEMGHYQYDAEVLPDLTMTFPTAKGKTEKETRDYCKKAVTTSAAGKVCTQTIPKFDASDFIDQCVLDVQVLDDFDTSAESAVNSMASTCEEITLREVNKYWKNDTSGVLEPPSVIGDNICENDCSGNGKCDAASCVCNKGFISSDCSMVEGEPPVLVHVAYNGLCDIRKQDCVRTRVVGYNFYDSKKLQCRSTEVTISDNDPVKSIGEPYTRVSQLLSFAELSCMLPKIPVNINGDHENSEGKPVGGFYLELSNDGETFSNNKSLFIVYDSKCMECSGTVDEKRTCKWKDNSCKMNNYCFASGDPNPKDWCQVCDPKRSNTSFVKRQTKNEAPVFNITSMLHAFKGQKWRFEIPVSDPESQMMVYEFIGESHSMEISSAGVLTWYPREYNKTYNFIVKATDPCGLSSQQKYVVRTSRCQCEGQNDGVCVWETYGNGTMESVCQCPQGCTGPKCVDAIMGRICRIKSGGSTNESHSDATAISLAIIFSLIAVALVLVGLVVYKLKKEKKPINAKNMKQVTATATKNAKSKIVVAAVTVYNRAHHKNDENVTMKSVAAEKEVQPKLNPGYVPN